MGKTLRETSPAKLIALSSFASLSLVAGLATFIYFSFAEVVREQTTFAATINISGRQRMLSQRSAYFTTEYAESSLPRDKERALESIETLRDNHGFLVSAHFESLRNNTPSPLSPELKSLFFEEPFKLDAGVEEYVSLVTEILAAEGEQNRQSLLRLKRQSQQILELFDAVVRQYELESRSKIAELTQLQTTILIAIVGFVLFQIVFVIRPLLRVSENLTKRLQEDANRDYLTGLYNRRIFIDLAEQALFMSDRSEQALSLVIFDIDNFKRVNDEFGHSVGDKVIQCVAQIILSASRKSDEVFRFGGEEFVVLLPQTGREGALLVAEKIRESVQKLSANSDQCPHAVTISGGVITQEDGQGDLESLLRQADAALYAAKQQHKNSIVAM